MTTASNPPDSAMKSKATLESTSSPESRQAYQRIKRSLDRCLELHHRSPVGYLVVDADARILHANATIGDLLSTTLSELLFNQLSHFVHSTDQQRFESRFQAFYQDPAGKEIEIRFQRKDGGFFIGQLTGNHIRSDMPAQHPPQLLISVLDVTIRSRAERLIRRAKRQWEQTFDAVPDLIAIIDENQVIRRINKPFAQRLERTVEACVGRKCHDLIYAKSVCPTDCPHYLSQQNGVPARSDRYIEKLKGHFSIFATPFPLESVSESWHIVIYNDISERKLAEQELFRSRNMESIGCLAGGIAHDYSNLLNNVMGFIELAKANRSDEELLTSYLSSSLHALEHAKTMTDKLLSFSSCGPAYKQPTDIERVVEDITPLGLHGSSATYQIWTEGELQPVSVEDQQIKVALNNIITNAREAMPQGGNLKITLRQVSASNGQRRDGVSGDYVEIQLQDDGCGIPASEVNKVFDPYYTTKAKGSEKGMGLGLAIAFAIIRKHDGRIAVQSAVGKGTLVTVQLPSMPTDA